MLRLTNLTDDDDDCADNVEQVEKKIHSIPLSPVCLEKGGDHQVR